MYSRIFFNQLLMGLKIYLRVPSAMFWMIAFPIVMLMGMGTIFGGSSNSGIKLVWSQTAADSSEDVSLRHALAELGLTLEMLTPTQAEERWKEGKLPALLERQGERYSMRVNSYLSGQGMPVVSLVQQGFLMVQARALGTVELTRIPVVMSSPGGHHDGPYAAYLLPGLLGLNLLMMGVFSTGMVDVTLREKGGYKRLATTPLPRHIYLAAQLGVRLTVVIAAAAMLMLVGALVFGITNQGSYLSLLVLLVLGSACFTSMGYLLASFARNVDVYSGFSNMVFLPLMLLSGVYFSLDSAPVWLQRGADILPLTPLLKALRAVFNDGASLTSLGSSLAILAGWTLLLFVLASKRFRWV
ncbi:ABC transporter permease [Solimicrobium silvestre]|uniref:Transport permease protein n=1 Tax=Solimicrobium silvestre TaxID=2099400 RepID=A0A2S9H5I2_9BURK|nr:ABC transporter permease [Solimicrobium silvestre]PRC95245.1 ABC-2 type transporter [Solimicrobium silvestre]